MAIVFVLIFATALASSQDPRTSPGMDLINLDNLSLIEYDKPIQNDIGNCSHCNISAGFETSCSGKIMSSLKVVEGKDGKALQLLYALDNCSDSYAEINLSFDPPQDLSAYDHLVIDWKGNQRANSLNVGIADAKGTQQIAPLYRHVTQKSWWGPLVVPFRYIGRDLDFSEVKKIFISIKNDSDTADYKDEGGIGSITIDNLRAINISARKNPLDFETVTPDSNASRAAAKWLLSQQQPSGLLKSWECDDDRLSHLYDQALALIVFSQEEDMSDNATQLLNALVEMQNEDGSWNQTYDFSTLNSTTDDKWIGDVAWVIYALNRYIELVGEHPGAKKAIGNGTIWLQEQIESIPAEGAIDAWWALKASGKEKKSRDLRNFIMESFWDEEVGRFKAGKDDWKPVSDVQTWGAAMLKATGEKEKALRALSYAREALLVTSQDQNVTALGDQAGPWSVSNECTGQYIVAGGNGSNHFLQELISQQRNNGSMPGSPDNFKGAGAWNTQWHGVAPTAWLYFASNKGPFDF